MKLSPAKSHMYPWCDYTSNLLAGRCPHDCKYCYMKDLRMYPQVRQKYSGRLRVSQGDLEKPTGKHKVRRREDVPFVPSDVPIIFVCSGNDLGATPVDAKISILEDCNEYPSYYYLIQSKNPAGFKEVERYFPPNVILGTTTETNRSEICREISNAPDPQERIQFLGEFNGGYRKMISVEPKLACDPPDFSELILEAEPDFVSIGADRGGRHNLSEPSREVLIELINRFEEFTLVYKKKNLNRLLKV